MRLDSNFARISRERLDHGRGREVHDHVGMSLDQRHQRGDLVEDGALLRCADQIDHPGRRRLAVALHAAHRSHGLVETFLQPGEHRGGIEVVAGEERVEPAAQMALQPVDGRELHAVGLLVQAHPEPEVGRVDLEFAFDGDDVRRHEQEPSGGTVGAVVRIELAEHLARQEREDRTDLDAGDV